MTYDDQSTALTARAGRYGRAGVRWVRLLLPGRRATAAEIELPGRARRQFIRIDDRQQFQEVPLELDQRVARAPKREHRERQRERQ